MFSRLPATLIYISKEKDAPTHQLYHYTMRKDTHRLRRAIGLNIRQRRDRLHMPLSTLAKNSGIDAISLDHFELGKSEIHLYHIIRIANALDMKPEELLWDGC